MDWGLALPVGRQGVFKQSTERTLDLGAGSGSHDSRARRRDLGLHESGTGHTGAELDQRSDIYSLGATLFKLISGKAAFEGRVSDVRHASFVVIFLAYGVQQASTQSIGGDLPESHVGKARDRYATALELAQDVDNYLADAAVSALTNHCCDVSPAGHVGIGRSFRA